MIITLTFAKVIMNANTEMNFENQMVEETPMKTTEPEVVPGAPKKVRRVVKKDTVDSNVTVRKTSKARKTKEAQDVEVSDTDGESVETSTDVELKLEEVFEKVAEAIVEPKPETETESAEAHPMPEPEKKKGRKPRAKKADDPEETSSKPSKKERATKAVKDKFPVLVSSDTETDGEVKKQKRTRKISPKTEERNNMKNVRTLIADFTKSATELITNMKNLKKVQKKKKNTVEEMEEGEVNEVEEIPQMSSTELKSEYMKLMKQMMGCCRSHFCEGEWDELMSSNE